MSTAASWESRDETPGEIEERLTWLPKYDVFRTAMLRLHAKQIAGKLR